MPTVPHRFECLTARRADPVLFVGAGLSYGLVPSPRDLHQGYANAAEQALGCHGAAPAASGDGALYVWAQAVLEQCDTADPRPAKLRLADALGILDEPSWLGKQGVPLRGTTPRHRVIARLAREGRWVAIWSLNWDCLIENALEEVGLVRDGPPLGYSWKSAYSTHVTDHDLPKIAANHSLCVHKPHGCVRALIDAQRNLGRSTPPTSNQLAARFMITAAELKQRQPDSTDQCFADELSTKLRSHPLIVAGWRAAEPILRERIKLTVAGLPEKPRLSIINRSLDHENHGHLVESYGLEAENALFQVMQEGCPTTDELFLWMQALYAAACLEEHVDTPADQANLTEWSRTLSHPDDAAFMMSFVDDFLPAWMRLCWRAGLVSCRGFEPEELDLLLKPEVHVPWGLPDIERPDLQASVRLLAMLPPGGAPWECDRFPGALWDAERLRLVVPIPAWGTAADLSGLRPLIAALQRDLGFVQTLAILPLGANGKQVSVESAQQLRLRLASLIRRLGFAQSDRIELQDTL